ncbi:LAME_0D01090g1_1 [Lachancea meyersii CBS 8951]|uniref:Pre-mRNA-splicing factor ATP-dependent RNA helicase PRP16 n=1 Tax=Lachancea meyersii CBS 8951 TaxID=1266667 RepID=A0A1G4J6A0_9SACH|nr:LAME_0D01090g1_1 [Lachancea meyersii CBS 8951]
MSSELIDKIQQHTKSNVTKNFVRTVENLAKVHHLDANKFASACMALGKFKGQDEFLKQLHLDLTAGSMVQSGLTDDLSQNANVSRQADKKNSSRTPRKLGTRGLQFDDDDEEPIEEHQVHSAKLDEPVTPLGRVNFKKLSKDKAQRLKEFSEPNKEPSTSTPNESLQLAIPEMVAFQQPTPDANKSEEKEDDASAFEDDSATEDQKLDEDRDWYNHDDDYGNEVFDTQDINEKEQWGNGDKSMTRKKLGNRKDTHSQIHLSTMSLSQRQDFLPPFLLKYAKDPAAFASIGGLIASQNSSDRRVIDSIRNAESDFSVNAKKGSRLVAERRNREVHKSKMQETAELKGTAMGQVIGLKETGKDSARSDPETPDQAQHSESFEQIQAARKLLPAYKVKSELLRIIRDNQVVIVIGETGSGKTTQLAQFLKEDGYCNDGQSIGCTQPRRVAAMSVATRVALEMGVKLGHEVGYSIRFEDKTSHRTRIKFMTDGILLRETLMSSMLDKYSCIIMDEAHERSLNTDILFGIFKNLLSARRDLKLIITSATMNAAKFSQFFGAAPLFTIPGRTFPVQTVFSRHPVSDYVESAIVQASKIHLSFPISSGDILIFMTGQEDIEATCEGLREKLTGIYAKKKSRGSEAEELDDIDILPIYSALPADVQGRIFNSTPNKRKVVVATNIAETSLTVDGIKYVIDCGYSKLKVYNPQIGLDSLQMVPISMASANQRSGRAGRTGPGIAYRLYTEDSFFDDMYVQTIPEIQRTNLSNTLLLLKYLGFSDLISFPFVDPPPEQITISSLFELWTVGALDNFGELTKLGRQMAAFPLQPPLSKMLLNASMSGCSEEILTIVSMLSVPQIFYRPKERQEESDQARARFFVPESDHLTLLNVYAQWKANNYSASWCRRHFLQFKSLQRAKDIREQLTVLMERKNVPLVSSGSDWDVIRKCICCGYAHQAGRLSGLSKYAHLRNGLEMRVHPASALFGAGDLPSYVVYHEMLLTTNEYINMVTAVDPLWLIDYGLLFYNISRRKEEEEDQGLYADESPRSLKDSIDLAIERALMKKEIVKRQLLKDRDMATVECEKEPFGGKVQSAKEEPKAKVGFKRRRPF